MAEQPRKPSVDLIKLLKTSGIDLNLKSAEAPEEQASRLRREEDEQTSRLRREEAEDSHKRRLSLLVHSFVLVMVAGAFAVSSYLVVVKDAKTGLPDKAIGVITAIVAAGVGYITGKTSK